MTPDLRDRLQRMVGFRNVAVHQYQALNLEVIESVIQHHLDDLRCFTGLEAP